MLFTANTVSNEELNSINNFFDSFEAEVTTVSPEEAYQETSVSKYITSLATGIYAKSVADIANTNVGNKIVGCFPIQNNFCHNLLLFTVYGNPYSSYHRERGLSTRIVKKSGKIFP